jgi:hypothetical protein
VSGDNLIGEDFVLRTGLFRQSDNRILCRDSRNYLIGYQYAKELDGRKLHLGKRSAHDKLPIRPFLPIPLDAPRANLLSLPVAILEKICYLKRGTGPVVYRSGNFPPQFHP